MSQPRMILVDADALPVDASRCPRDDCGITLAFIPFGGCGEPGCLYEEESEADFESRMAEFKEYIK